MAGADEDLTVTLFGELLVADHWLATGSGGCCPKGCSFRILSF